MNKIAPIRPGSLNSADPAAPRGKKPIQDLREWLCRVERMGELVRIHQPVDRDEEMSAITYLVAKQHPSPAVLFEHPKGFQKNRIGARMLWNFLAPA